MKDSKEILQTICNYHSIDLDLADCREALETLYNRNDDAYIEIDGAEFRIIHKADIWNIYVDDIEQLVKDCYDLNLDSVPDFVALSIDWEETAKNAYVDGYGHHFSGYDGSELETDNYYIFRTN